MWSRKGSDGEIKIKRRKSEKGGKESSELGKLNLGVPLKIGEKYNNRDEVHDRSILYILFFAMSFCNIAIFSEYS